MDLTAMTAKAGFLDRLQDAGMTVLIGVVVVFSVLILLTLIFKLFGVVTGFLTKKDDDTPVQKPVAPKAKPQPVASVPAVQSGVSGEVVAAIAAAVAAMAEADGKTYAVRRISRAAIGGRSAWAAAGVAENTRSF